MKRIIPILMIAALLAGCGSEAAAEPTISAGENLTATEPAVYPELVNEAAAEIAYNSRFSSETAIVLSDEGVTVDGLAIDENSAADGGIWISHDITYYEEKTEYDSGNPYGEGTKADMHTAGEAAAHTVVNITQPGAYRISGKLSAGQIRIDLGSKAYYDEDAVVELILDGADITCTVAPAILFQNVYECDGEWDADAAQSAVDTSAAGANLILEGENAVSGSYVAKIYKDDRGEKKLCKQDGAIYSYMSMNVYGPGSLDLTAENEGLDTELHLTVNGGKITIRSGNDGINTNEDGVSVTTINAGSLHIIAGLGEEGDGIDSNGYLVINGGTVVSSANPASDAGLDSDMGSFINGGTVIALGSTMDWAENDSAQVTMNLQFADFQSSGSSIVITQENGTVVFAYDPGEDELLGENTRRFQGAIISCPNLVQGCSYHVYMDASVTGEEAGGVYDVLTVTGCEGGAQMTYTGTDVTMGGPGMGGMMGGGNRGDFTPEDFDGELPEGFGGEDFDPGAMGGEMPTMPEGEMPEADADQPGRGQRPGGNSGNFGKPEGETTPEGETLPENFGGFGLPEGETMPADFDMDGMKGSWDSTVEGVTAFYMQDMVNFFSGVTAAETAE